MTGRRGAGTTAGVGAVTVLLALGAAGCATPPVPAGPPMPMTTAMPYPMPYPMPTSMPMMTARPAPPVVGNGEPDDDRGRGPMTSGRTTSTAPDGGELAGEGLDAAAVAELQAAVDRGVQPWRLDRVMVAEAFAQSRLGWPMPWVRDTGTTALVEGPDRRRVVLHLAQPGRRGPHGVWVVTDGSWVD